MGSSIILFDGICNFCNASINFIIKHDSKNQFRFAPLQSEVGRQLLNHFDLDDSNSDTIILIENNKLYKRSDAVLRIARHLDRAYCLLFGFLIVPRFLRDGIYKYISVNRYKWFGKSDKCIIPTPEIRLKFLS